MESTNDQSEAQLEEKNNRKGSDATSDDTKREDEGESQSKEELTEKASAAPAADTEPEKNEGIRRLILVMTLTLACFLVTLDASIIVTAIPKITNQFHSVQDVGWYGSAYLLASCSLQPLTGKFYNQFASKYTFMIFIAIFELGSTICGAAQSSKMLIVGRAIAGMGTSGMVNGALTILSASVPLHIRATYFGFMMSTIQLGVLFGPLIGGSLTQYTTWRWCFFINLPCGAICALILFFLRIPDNTAKTAIKGSKREILLSFDLQGFAIFAPTAIMCLLAVQWGGTQFAWNSATIIGLFCGSAAMLVIFLFWEARAGDRAMIPFSMLTNRVVWVSCLYMFCFYSSMIIWIYYLPIYFQSVRGISPTLSGVYMLPLIAGQMIGATSSGMLIGRLGYYLPWAIASGVLTSISSGLLSTFEPNTSTGKWVGYLILGGFGRGFGIQIPMVAVQNHIKHEQNSTAMAILVFSQNFGGALFLSFADVALTTALREGISRYAPTVNISTILSAGASGFRSVIPKSSVHGVVLAYNLAIKREFYIAAALSVATFGLAWGMGWKSVKKAKAKAATSEA